MNVVARTLFSIFLCFSVHAAPQPAAPVFVVGDLHADVDALRRILVGLSLIDKNDNWIGGDAELVTLGDHLDRGNSSRGVMDLLIKLESQSVSSGGKVTNLIGNHEYFTVKGHYEYANYEDMAQYREFKLGARGNGYDKAFVGDTKYAQWFRSRPAMYKAGDTLFAHAGISEKMLSFSIDEINSLVTAWMKFEQGVGPQPDPTTEWVTMNEGPLWSRGLSYKSDTHRRVSKNPHAIKSEALDKLLAHFGAKRIVIGHSPMEEFEYTVDHPFYGERVISVDTGISIADNKLVTGFKIESTNGVSEVTGYHFDRKSQRLIQTVTSKKGSRGNMCARFY